jgi:formate hydrogenlyase subunit 6/NADH:ubiquinone oxidoreductase subunit I
MELGCEIGYMSERLAKPDKHCNHTLQKCIHYGNTGRWSVKYMGSRQITFEEVSELLRKCNAEGMVHTIDIDGMICNCCKKCCPLFRGVYELNTKTLTPSPFLPQIDADNCSACSACVDACPVGARVFGNTLDQQSPISLFIRNNRVQVLRPESGNSPKVFYVGIDKEVS